MQRKKAAVKRPVGRPRAIKPVKRISKRVRGGCNGDIMCKRCGGCRGGYRGGAYVKGACAQCGYDPIACVQPPYNDTCDFNEVIRYQDALNTGTMKLDPSLWLMQQYLSQVSVPKIGGPEKAAESKIKKASKLAEKEEKRRIKEQESQQRAATTTRKSFTQRGQTSTRVTARQPREGNRFGRAPPPSSSRPIREELFSPSISPPRHVREELFSPSISPIRDEAEIKHIVEQKIAALENKLAPLVNKPGTISEKDERKINIIYGELRRLYDLDIASFTDEQAENFLIEHYYQEYESDSDEEEPYRYDEQRPTDYYTGEAKPVHVIPSFPPATITTQHPDPRKVAEFNKLLGIVAKKPSRIQTEHAYNWDPKLLSPAFTFGDSKYGKSQRYLVTGPQSGVPPLPLGYFEKPVKKIRKVKPLSKDITKAVRQLRAKRKPKLPIKKKDKKTKILPIPITGRY